MCAEEEAAAADVEGCGETVAAAAVAALLLVDRVEVAIMVLVYIHLSSKPGDQPVPVLMKRLVFNYIS